MPRGGRRSGRVGKSYANRSDLNGGPLPVQTAPSPQYGARVASERQQQAVPLSAPPTPPPAAQPQQMVERPAPPDLFAPTMRPDEPLTAGIDGGAGPGSEAINATDDPVTLDLRRLYLAYPNEDLRELIEDRESGWF